MICNFYFYLLGMEIKFSKFLDGVRLRVFLQEKKRINKKLEIYINFLNKLY